MSPAPPTLVDELLLEQLSLTAVERFSQRHEDVERPIQEKYYHDLIPLNQPREGEQYTFEVDLDACSGCKACVSACHSLNGLDEGESWRDIGSLLNREPERPSQQTVTTACHHCLDPACANGCPTMAYEKDETTGIVRHLDDQCIGCRYCELKCPYEVPKFNDRLGIVRKCDMCHSRLAEGEAPACVQACPNQAIRIRIVPKEEILEQTQADRLLPGTVTSTYTKPTTRFLNLRHGDTATASDHHQVHAAHGHFPLVWMLVLTQAGAGVAASDYLQRSALQADVGLAPLLTGLLLALAGLAGSILHLGRPLQAWRAFLGWKTSWLSREIIIFGGWSTALMGYVAAVILMNPSWLHLAVGAAASIAGLVGVFTSVMVYADTRREFWALPFTGMRFFSTMAVCGLLLSPQPAWTLIPLALLLGLDAMIGYGALPQFERQSKLFRGQLMTPTLIRLGAGIAAASLIAFPWAALALFLLSELAGRSLFFRAVDEPKMPG